MFYAVNTLTREHWVYSVRSDLPVVLGGNYDIAQADADGWIEWHGGVQPLPDRHPVEVKTYQGLHLTGEADDYYWGEGNPFMSRVTAYRPILDEKPQAPEWDGKGLPPVGVRAEFSINDGKYRPAVVKYKSSKFCILHYDPGCKGERCYTSDHHIDARPIRTDREKWIEVAEPLSRTGNTETVLGRIYDALKSGELPQP